MGRTMGGRKIKPGPKPKTKKMKEMWQNRQQMTGHSNSSWIHNLLDYLQMCDGNNSDKASFSNAEESDEDAENLKKQK